jgi:hypothetical protein
LLNPVVLGAKTHYHPDSTPFNFQLKIMAIDTGLNRKYLTRYGGYGIKIVTGFKIQSGITL